MTEDARLARLIAVRLDHWRKQTVGRANANVVAHAIIKQVREHDAGVLDTKPRKPKGTTARRPMIDPWGKGRVE